MLDTAPHSPRADDSVNAAADGTPEASTNASEPRIDTRLVNDLLMGTWAGTRREVRELLKDPRVWKIDGLTVAELGYSPK